MNVAGNRISGGPSCSLYARGLKVFSHLTSFSPLNGRFFVSTVSIVFMNNGQNAILSVFQPVTTDTMLNKNGPLNGAALNGLKDVKCEQTFSSDSNRKILSSFHV